MGGNRYRYYGCIKQTENIAHNPFVIMNERTPLIHHSPLPSNKWLCRLALPGWTPLLLEVERQLMSEFDYHNEARNLKSVRRNMMDSPYRHKVQVPQPIMKFSSRNVLIMEYLDGIKLEQAVENDLVSALKGDRALAKSLIKAKRTGKITTFVFLGVCLYCNPFINKTVYLLYHCSQKHCLKELLQTPIR